MLSLDHVCELTPAFVPCDYRIKWADSAWEREEARRLRRAVFCIEQGVFVGDDTDAIDAYAQPLVAVSQVGGLPAQVVGTVRIHVGRHADARADARADAHPNARADAHADARADAAQVWWGSRLAVHAAFRHQGRLGATLIRLAVSSAHALGAQTFLAHVQGQNVALFKRLHWQVLREETLHGRPHALMQADLAQYPPCHDPQWGFSTQTQTQTHPHPHPHPQTQTPTQLHPYPQLQLQPSTATPTRSAA